MGHISKPHGIRGEVVVHPLTDHPEGAFAPGVVLLLSARDGAPDPAAPPLRVEGARAANRGWLVRFGGIRDRNDAERYRGRDLLRPLADLEPLDEGEVFYHQLLGLEVFHGGEESLGRVREVYEMQPADLLEVAGPRGVLLIPFRKEIVTSVDVEAGRMTIDPPPGLLEL
ncbi:ribosome maturation factor RimM [Gemmatimonadota bacterium CCK-12]